MSKVTIDELSREIAADVELTDKKTKEVVRQIFEVMAENLEEGHEINVPEFGKFRVKESKARTGRNPKTGEEIDIPAKKAPNFLAAKNLKNRIKVT